MTYLAGVLAEDADDARADLFDILDDREARSLACKIVLKGTYVKRLVDLTVTSDRHCERVFGGVGCAGFARDDLEKVLGGVLCLERVVMCGKSMWIVPVQCRCD